MLICRRHFENLPSRMFNSSSTVMLLMGEAEVEDMFLVVVIIFGMFWFLFGIPIFFVVAAVFFFYGYNTWFFTLKFLR